MRLSGKFGMVAASLAAMCILQPFTAAEAKNPYFYFVGKHKFVAPPPPPVQAAPTVNVKDYGATGDGTTDDSSSIQAAVTAARASGQGVFFPPGTYLHNAVLTFPSIAVTGAGSSSILQAGNKDNTAVFLTGQAPSLQNIVVQSTGLTGSSSASKPNSATVLVQQATNFVIANDTIVQGPNRFGIYIQKSSVGGVSAVAFDAAGNGGTGIFLDGSANVNITFDLFQNQNICIQLSPVSGLLSGIGSQFINVANNTFGNVTYPTQKNAVNDSFSNLLNITSNIVQMGNNNSGTVAFSLTDDSNVLVQSNEVWNGWNGLVATSTLAGLNNIVAMQNVIRNVGSSALAAGTTFGISPAISVSFLSNSFGEAGLTDNSAHSAVITVLGNTNKVANVQIQNNGYFGSPNDLVNYVYAPNVPAANITGNTQSQTMLPGVPNN